LILLQTYGNVLNMSPLESLGQIAEKAAVESQISFHNIAMHIARARLGRAERISEHMEHKIELYDSLHVIGRLALEGPNPSTEEPETLVERVTEWKIDRRAAKQNRAYLINHQSEKIYGRARNELPKSIGQTVFEALTTDDNVPGSDVHSSIIGNTVAFFTGPDVKGKTNLSK
jgi:hypothetical protein